jgi:hypothetical protein
MAWTVTPGSDTRGHVPATPARQYTKSGAMIMAECHMGMAHQIRNAMFTLVDSGRRHDHGPLSVGRGRTNPKTLAQPTRLPAWSSSGPSACHRPLPGQPSKASDKEKALQRPAVWAAQPSPFTRQGHKEAATSPKAARPPTTVAATLRWLAGGMVPWYARNDQGSRMSDAGSLALVMGAGRGEGS